MENQAYLDVQLNWLCGMDDVWYLTDQSRKTNKTDSDVEPDAFVPPPEPQPDPSGPPVRIHPHACAPPVLVPPPLHVPPPVPVQPPVPAAIVTPDLPPVPDSDSTVLPEVAQSPHAIEPLRKSTRHRRAPK